MAGLTGEIERFIKELLEEENSIELTRKSIAEEFNCAPSQINYVLSTRFPSTSGYIIESKRGGGGYIRIIKMEVGEETQIYDWINFIGDEITKGKAQGILTDLNEEGIITLREAKIMNMALNDRSLSVANVRERNRLRASIFKHMLLVLAEMEE